MPEIPYLVSLLSELPKLVKNLQNCLSEPTSFSQHGFFEICKITTPIIFYVKFTPNTWSMMRRLS